jgi:hypothetical protein
MGGGLKITTNDFHCPSIISQLTNLTDIFDKLKQGSVSENYFIN